MRILFVCLGNICRSPLAQGILERKASMQGLDWMIDSSGTGHWHIGESPDPRTLKIAKRYGIDIGSQRARQFKREDYLQFDLILTADDEVHREVLSLAPEQALTSRVRTMVSLLDDTQYREVPDPWYGGEKGFEEVYRLLDEICDALIARVIPSNESAR